MIAKMERQISAEYRKAHKEVTEKLEDYMERFRLKDEKWRQWVRQGKRTPEEYQKWRTGQIMMGQRWSDLKDTLAEDYSNAHEISRKIVLDNMAEVYCINHNFGTYLIEHKTRLDTSYTLYQHDAIERLWRENPVIYHAPGRAVQSKIASGELKRWNRQQIQSVMTQGILQGESIPNLTKRLERVTGGNHKAAIRNARTMTTGIGAAGRLDAFNRASSMGIKNKKVWIANLDGRTRHWHRDLDGVSIPNDQAFVNDYGEIMYPGDPGADPANIYNCRCDLNTQIEGHEIDYTDLRLRYTDKLGDMTYEEWKAEKKSTSDPITKQEDIARAMRGSYIREYRRG